MSLCFDGKVPSQKKHGKEEECFSCTKCSRTYGTKRQYLKHQYNTHHTPTKPCLACPNCNATFNTERSFQNHVDAANRTNRKSICSICGKVFCFDRDLRKHFETEHHDNSTEKIFKCKVCKAGFSYTKNLLKHEKSHELKQHICDICNQEFVNITNLLVHKLTHLNPDRSKTTSSGMTVTREVAYQVAKPIEKPFNCHVCGHRFKFDFSLKVHLEAHVVPSSAAEISNSSPNSSLTILIKKDSESLNEDIKKSVNIEQSIELSSSFGRGINRKGIELKVETSSISIPSKQPLEKKNHSLNECNEIEMEEEENVDRMKKWEGVDRDGSKKRKFVPLHGAKREKKKRGEEEKDGKMKRVTEEAFKMDLLSEDNFTNTDFLQKKESSRNKCHRDGKEKRTHRKKSDKTEEEEIEEREVKTEVKMEEILPQNEKTTVAPAPVTERVFHVWQPRFRIPRPKKPSKHKRRIPIQYQFNCIMTDDKPFMCNVCEQAFRWEISLKIHTEEHEEGVRMKNADESSDVEKGRGRDGRRKKGKRETLNTGVKKSKTLPWRDSEEEEKDALFTYRIDPEMPRRGLMKMKLNVNDALQRCLNERVRVMKECGKNKIKWMKTRQKKNKTKSNKKIILWKNRSWKNLRIPNTFDCKNTPSVENVDLKPNDNEGRLLEVKVEEKVEVKVEEGLVIDIALVDDAK